MAGVVRAAEGRARLWDPSYGARALAHRLPRREPSVLSPCRSEPDLCGGASFSQNSENSPSNSENVHSEQGDLKTKIYTTIRSNLGRVASRVHTQTFVTVLRH